MSLDTDGFTAKSRLPPANRNLSFVQQPLSEEYDLAHAHQASNMVHGDCSFGETASRQWGIVVASGYDTAQNQFTADIF